MRPPSSKSSSKSDSSSSSDEPTAQPPDALSARISKKLLRSPLRHTMPISDHCKAVDAMLILRNILLKDDETEVPQSVSMNLTCAGIVLARRIAIGPDLDEQKAQFATTLALLFALLLLSKRDHVMPTGEDGDIECADIAAWKESTVEHSMHTASTASTSSWGIHLTSPGAVCQTILTHAQRLRDKLNMEELAPLSISFFQSSSQAIAAAMLANAAPPPADNTAFLTLDFAAYMSEANTTRTERLMGIAASADSEAGQAILRDMILSFRLPREVVGVRRTCLLSRESNRIATEQHSKLLGESHDAAMRGAPWSWEKDEDQMHQMCALLAGLCVPMLDNAQSIRKDDVCGGRIGLPFLECHAPEPDTLRLQLLEHSNEWLVYSLDAKGRPKVRMRQHGFEGFLQCILMFVSTLAS